MTWGQGENLYKVAAKFETDWMALWSLNGGSDPDVYLEKDLGGAGGTSVDVSSTTYRFAHEYHVRAGETLVRPLWRACFIFRHNALSSCFFAMCHSFASCLVRCVRMLAKLIWPKFCNGLLPCCLVTACVPVVLLQEAIAERFGTTVDHLLSLNQNLITHVHNPRSAHPGPCLAPLCLLACSSARVMPALARDRSQRS